MSYNPARESGEARYFQAKPQLTFILVHIELYKRPLVRMIIHSFIHSFIFVRMQLNGLR